MSDKYIKICFYDEICKVMYLISNMTHFITKYKKRIYLLSKLFNHSKNMYLYKSEF